MITDKKIPTGFIAKASADLGTDIAKKLLASLEDSEPCTSIRLNRRKSASNELPFSGMTPVGWCDSGYYIDIRPTFTLDPLLHAGVYYVQDASSMIYETIVGQITGEIPVRAADLCAAPGGKTTAMLNALPDGSVMLANEFSSARANILRENLTKYGYPDIVITNTEVRRLAGLKGYFDIVAVDAPCSGEGMMRKDETARVQWSESLVTQCASLQREIIESAVEMIAPGGYLIYSTCTFNTSEDEDNAAWIADTFGLEPIDTGLAGRHGIRGQVKGNIPSLRFMPGFTKGEGLFVTVFRKPEDEETFSSPKKSNKKRNAERKDNRQKIGGELLKAAEKWITGEFTLRQHDNRILALSPNTSSLLDSIPAGVRIISAGVEVCETKGKDLIPSHQLAMSQCLAKDSFPDIPLTLDDVLRFLSRETVTLPETTTRGYVTVSYAEHILGFMKHIGNRSNNLYPQNYRIHTRIPTQNATETC